MTTFRDVALLFVAALAACALPRGADSRSARGPELDPSARSAAMRSASSPPVADNRSASATNVDWRHASSDMNAPRRGVLLEELTWRAAETALTPDTVVVIPIGAAAKEHGPHLELQNDYLLAEYFKSRVLADADVVVAPTINYNYYPAFTEYPGSTSLRLETARDLVVDVCRSLAHFGPRRFYALNTGVSTLKALAPAAEILAADGILLHYTNLECLSAVEKETCRQEAGSHADEVETSIMLAIAPETVDMSKAVKDCNAKGKGGLSRDPRECEGPDGKTFSPSGVFGDPTLATREKGVKLADELTRIVLAEIESLRCAPLPDGRSASAAR
jgi:creatinine amidohydrolase